MRFAVVSRLPVVVIEADELLIESFLMEAFCNNYVNEKFLGVPASFYL